MWVVHRTRRAGVAAAREAEVLAHRLAEDGAAGVQNARHDGRIHVGHVALERRSAVHHRHSGDAHIVLDREPLAFELAAPRAFDRGLDVPRAVAVLLAAGAITGCARIFYRRQLLRHAIDGVIRIDAGPHQLAEYREIRLAHAEPEILRERLQLRRRRRLDRAECHRSASPNRPFPRHQRYPRRHCDRDRPRPARRSSSPPSSSPPACRSTSRPDHGQDQPASLISLPFHASSPGGRG